MNLHHSATILFLTLLLGACALAAADAAPTTIEAVRIDEPVTVDGVLDDAAWQRPPLTGEFVTFSPMLGRPLGVATDIWVAYSGRHLYFAFMCHDGQPGQIKTSITKRDAGGRDDWIGVILDPLDNRQSSFEYYVNPSGCQTDGLTSAVNGADIDLSPDWVWQSAARVGSGGYAVEVAIPLESLRYKSGERVRMGVIFMRNVPHLGAMGSWPGMKAGESQFNAMAAVEYRGLRKEFAFEALPAFTASSDRGRADGGGWGERDTAARLGVSLKYGVTSSITAEATVRPDFSQVESDAFQVEVNRRYPVLYSEKRPFFMEGTNAIDFGLVSNGMMSAAVYTRRIVDPDWAAKVSGTAGRTLFAVLAADESLPGGDGGHAFWGVGRFKLALGGDDSLGLLYSGRYAGDDRNSALGADLQYRLLANLRLTASAIYSRTELPGGEGQDGSGLNAMLQFAVPELDASLAYERYSANFSMASAFLVRTNFDQLQFFLGPNLLPKDPRPDAFLKRVQPYVRGLRLHDFATGLNDTLLRGGVTFYTRWNGALRLEYRAGREAWLWSRYRSNAFYALAEMQPRTWLYLGASANIGDRIYYDPLVPYPARGRTLSFAVILQPGARASLSLELLHDALRRRPAEGGASVYSLAIANLAAAYQFNRFFFVRAALRWNDYDRDLLTDLLASFTLIPGTVVHLGYGSSFQGREWRDGEWQVREGRLTNMKNSLFFKASYLWRFK